MASLTHPASVSEENQPPDILYHYTTLHGLVGIIQSKTLWLSDLMYLNDSREFVHTIELFDRAIAERTIASPDADVDAWQSLGKRLHHFKNRRAHTCVCAFTEKDDDLSQWRAYGGDSASFAIGFDRAFLETVATRPGFNFQKCVYVDIEHPNPDLMNLLFSDIHPSAFGVMLHRVLNQAPRIKDYKFRDEHEWRLVSSPLPPTDPRLCFRPGASMMIPFCVLPIAKPEFRIARVVVGPTPNRDLARRSVQSLLDRNDLPGITVENSRVPYRNW